ncbi:DMT family transporter [Cohnella thailandensis]|uniref:DMT family transporter n=1 Tax=Cohnella thailandensis TaxID=557557 RepID=A0A841SUT3_9BACL|nr:DMT family transporter [Cohnella thailandensis]MBB6633387.1 DMT family transporter [Cohnella thailandensis]MBP1977270.1 drug/metabolite transporter (DMT)-like permease [Cohnella thailandensis]
MKKIPVVYLTLTLSAIFWGANFNAGKIAVEVMSPTQVAAWRFIIAGLVILVLYWIKERPAWSSIKPYAWIYLLMGLIGIFLMNIFLFKGLAATSPIHTSLITATNPLLTLCLSVFLLKEKINLRQLAGIAISFLGVLFVLTNGSLTKLELISTGDLYVLLATALWALYGILGKKYVGNGSPLATTALTMAIGALFYLPYSSFATGDASSAKILEAWLAVIFMALFCSVLAYLWWNQGIARIGANQTSLFFNIVPISTMAISALSGESIGVAQMLGALATICGILWSTRTAKRSRSECFPQNNHV